MKRTLCFLLCTIMAMSILGACGKETPPADNTHTTQGQQATEAVNAGSVVFKYGVSEMGHDKNPYLTFMAISNLIFNENIYEKLFDESQDGGFEPMLATEWRVDDSGLRWTFKLREGVKWHDGEVFNADDVIYSYKTVIDYQLMADYDKVSMFTEINKIDDYTVELVTEKPKADIVEAMIPIVPEHIFSQCKTAEEIKNFQNPSPIGTGPFYYIEDKIDEYAKLGGFKEYWKSPIEIDELIFINYANPDTLLQALETGEVDFCSITSTQFDKASKIEGVTVNQGAIYGYTELGFNCWQDPASKGNPMIKDKVVRQAISMAIDYENIINYAMGGIASPQVGLLPVGYKAAVDYTKSPLYRENSPESAMELLDKHDYTDRNGDSIRESKNGKPMSFRLATQETNRDAALIVQKSLEKIGIKLEVQFVDAARLNEIIYSQDFDTDMHIWGWNFGSPDPSYCLSAFTTGTVNGLSDCFYSNPAYDELFEQQRTTVDPEKRQEILVEMQNILYDEMPYAPLYRRYSLTAYNGSRWTGWQHAPGEDGPVWNWYTWVALKPAQ